VALLDDAGRLARVEAATSGDPDYRSRKGVLSMKAARRLAKACLILVRGGRPRRQDGACGAVAQSGQGEAANQSR
jgi:hypothetical protein